MSVKWLIETALFSCISVPLQIKILPIPVVQIQTFPVQTIKILQSLFGKLGTSHSTLDAKKQSTRKQSHTSVNSKGNDVQDHIQVSDGTDKPFAPTVNNLQNDSKQEQTNFKQSKLQQDDISKQISDSQMLPSLIKKIKPIKTEQPSNVMGKSSNLQSTNALQLSRQANATGATLSHTISMRRKNFTGTQNKLPVRLGNVLSTANSPADNIQYSESASNKPLSTSAVKFMCGNMICAILRSPTSNTPKGANLPTHKKGPTLSLKPSHTSNLTDPTSSGFHPNSSATIHSPDTTKTKSAEPLLSSPAVGERLANGTLCCSLSQQTNNSTTSITPKKRGTTYRHLITTSKANIRIIPSTSNAKVYKKHTFSASKVKTSHNLFIALKRARTQDPSIKKGMAFTITEDRRRPIWIQQSDPLDMLPPKSDLPIPGKHTINTSNYFIYNDDGYKTGNMTAVIMLYTPLF